jgi:hypothetical protein
MTTSSQTRFWVKNPIFRPPPFWTPFSYYFSSKFWFTFGRGFRPGARRGISTLQKKEPVLDGFCADYRNFVTKSAKSAKKVCKKWQKTWKMRFPTRTPGIFQKTTFFQKSLVHPPKTV